MYTINTFYEGYGVTSIVKLGYKYNVSGLVLVFLTEFVNLYASLCSVNSDKTY